MEGIQANFKNLYDYHKYNLNSFSYKNDNIYDYKNYYKNGYIISHNNNDKNNLYQKQILLNNTNNCNNNNYYKDFDFILCDKNDDIKRSCLNLEFLDSKKNYKGKYNNDIPTQTCSDIYNFFPETEDIKDNKNNQYLKQILLGNNNNNINNIDYYNNDIGLKFCDKNNNINNRNSLNSVLSDSNSKERYDNDVITISELNISNFSQEKIRHNSLVEKKSNNTNKELLIYQSNVQYPYQNINNGNIPLNINNGNISLTTSKAEKNNEISFLNSEIILPKNYYNEYIQYLKENDISTEPLLWKKKFLNIIDNNSISGKDFSYEKQIFNNNYNPEQDFCNEKQFLNNQLPNELFNDIHQNNTSTNEILINISSFNNKDKKSLTNGEKNIIDIKKNINQINMTYQNYIIKDKNPNEELQSLYKTKYILHDESKQKKNTLLQNEKRKNIIKYNNAFFSKGLYVNTKTEGQINSNVRLFYGAKPFRCIYCKTTFKRKYDLLRHKRIHTGEKPYVCKICNRRFSRTDILKKHLKECINCSKLHI
ncbi:hypothetical protein H8356DRAFT_988453 [Neocallimastix lanati (nom. inval.)]|uniref:C2H2-type domain-containing protein n=1 Tax=Neocallimastix californiae TaxID=1754190 RepID=A0A1Y2ETK6_9FUNG|nr:hypothetical protein H8356DRAFT_988453 [Neocallimastix sp. JGI-2020a]ORY74903.1 hypothetical protein LY90DRAFT_699130 [Neocallimastix californiae]|eukprot:ORY74903.1 hypothetical protein LY90DRAFT_699130 [Neocallimastix californiae]